MLVSEAVREFLRFMELRRGVAHSTIQTYGLILSRFTLLVNDKQVSELKLADIDRYADWLTEQNYKPKTYRCKLAAVKSLVNYLWIKDYITFRPDQIITRKIKDTDSEPNFLTGAEAKKLIKVCKNVRDRAMLLTLISTCTRVSEFIDLRLEDIYERSIIVRNGKGGKRRVVFLNKEAEKAINKYFVTLQGGNNRLHGRTKGYLFPNPQGNKLSRVYVARQVSYYATLAKIDKKVTTHTLRHTGLTLLLRGGARVEDTQQIAGHANIRTTMIYLHFTNEDLHRTFDESMSKLKTLT